MNPAYYESKFVSVLNKRFPFFLNSKLSKTIPNHKLIEKIFTSIFIFLKTSTSLFERVIEEPNDSTKAFQKNFHNQFKDKYSPEILIEIETLMMSFVQYSHFLKASIQNNPDKELAHTVLNIEEVEKDIKKNFLKALKKSQKKHPAISGLIGNSYFGIENSIDKNLEYLKIANRFLRKFENHENYIELFFAPKSGRPKDFIFDHLLVDLHAIAIKHFPRSPYAKLLKPILLFTADHYPNLVDKNDVKDWDLLRKRIEYQKKVEKKKKKSS